MSLTYGDFFTGFGGMTIGAKEAGLNVLFGVEWEEALANVYRKNLGDHVIVADVTKLDMSTLPYVDIFHASPPCTNASVANANGGESPFDMAMATAVCRYIVAKQPRIFTMENVYQYRNFESWHEIARTLLAEGYTYNYWHVNMANYGVPQTRKRMIVVARRDGTSPSLPEHTHAENPVPGLFDTKKRWVSWYETIEDLIPTLPNDDFSDWQYPRLPKNDLDFLIMTGNKNLKDAKEGRGCRYKWEPSNTVSAGIGGKEGHAKVRINGECKRLTQACYALLQSFPQWYEIPNTHSKGIGNAVPPLFAEKLYKHLRR